MDAKTEREVLVEYPLDVVYDTLIYLFPVKHFRLYDNDDDEHEVVVEDSSNDLFIMKIKAMENSPNTTLIYFFADFPHAIADLTGGGKKAIDMVLDELLIELDKKPKPEGDVGREYENIGDVEVVNAKTFVSSAKTEKNTKTIILGYAFCILSIVIPAYVMTADNRSSLMAMLFAMSGVIFSLAISVSAILQTSENRKSVMHGRIQTIICGIIFVIAGILIHPSLAIAGIIITAIILGYYIKNERDLKNF